MSTSIAHAGGPDVELFGVTKQKARPAVLNLVQGNASLAAGDWSIDILTGTFQPFRFSGTAASCVPKTWQFTNCCQH